MIRNIFTCLFPLFPFSSLSPFLPANEKYLRLFLFKIFNIKHQTPHTLYIWAGIRNKIKLLLTSFPFYSMKLNTQQSLDGRDQELFPNPKNKVRPSQRFWQLDEGGNNGRDCQERSTGSYRKQQPKQRGQTFYSRQSPQAGCLEGMWLLLPLQ